MDKGTIVCIIISIVFLISTISAAKVLAPAIISKIRNGCQKIIESMDYAENKISEKISGLNISFPEINESALKLLELYLRYQKLNNESNLSFNSSLLLKIKDSFDNETIQSILEKFLALDDKTREKFLKETLGNNIGITIGSNYFQKFGYNFTQTKNS